MDFTPTVAVFSRPGVAVGGVLALLGHGGCEKPQEAVRPSSKSNSDRLEREFRRTQEKLRTTAGFAGDCNGGFAHTHSAHSVAFSPDGKLLASGSGEYSYSIKLWSVPDGALVKALTGVSLGVNSVAFSPDGKVLASGGGDGSIKLWSIPDGVLVKSIGTSHSSVLWGVPDGNFQTCLVDLAANTIDLARTLPEIKGSTYNQTDEQGRVVTYTLACGSPAPPGAVCTCNCVPGTYIAPAQSSGGGRICTCVPVCTCLAVRVR